MGHRQMGKGCQAGIRGTHGGSDALQLGQGHFVVHAANVPPHIIILGHRDLHRVGTAVTIPLPTLRVTQGWGTALGQEGIPDVGTDPHPSHSLPQELSAASGTLRAGQKVPKELGYLRNGHTGPPKIQTEVPKTWIWSLQGPGVASQGVDVGMEWLSQGLGLGVLRMWDWVPEAPPRGPQEAEIPKFQA